MIDQKTVVSKGPKPDESIDSTIQREMIPSLLQDGIPYTLTQIRMLPSVHFLFAILLIIPAITDFLGLLAKIPGLPWSVLIIQFICMVIFFSENALERTFFSKLFRIEKSHSLQFPTIGNLKPKIIMVFPFDETRIKGLWNRRFFEMEKNWVKLTLLVFNLSIINTLTTVLGDFPSHPPIAIATCSYFFLSSLVRFFLHLEFLASKNSQRGNTHWKLAQQLHKEISKELGPNGQISFLMVPGIYSLSDGMDQFLKLKNQEIDQKTIFIEIGPCDKGVPDYIRSHGMLRKHQLGGELFFHLESLSRRLPWKPKGQDWTTGPREVQILRNNGFQACCIANFPNKDDEHQNPEGAQKKLINFLRFLIQETANS